ncbi:3-oxoacyl-ACP synthase III family protein [Mycolicibacterium fluoranthenivorans]|uniref:3-oxoacyl-[acyl-carrier-protein] synthase-3 n=1 Tax=Mycolicibacterium fluoranthenivorans TaxID=258505 RepID=A0A1G4WRQ5_9MYCO|nr:3-oxoacyl-[acyl-carrier-protein] synthase III C-terminal domain-containing protein [Mycolicibacterium fluoranthenivorans]SCX28062.1 3-oxoacyl-[acyl-carrier-protein] synthase-3 [Mycolicibacterium fluoranthenivorans]
MTPLNQRNDRYSTVVDVAVHLPTECLSTAQVEARIADLNPGLDLPRGLLQRMSGVANRHIAPPDWRPSDLAVAAARALLQNTCRDIADIDLIIFAATSGDGLEPATAHFVADKLGARCPVFDVNNTCCSIINAIEVADSLIRGGSYRSVLITCGENPSRIAKWTFRDTNELLERGAVHIFSDAGAALLLEAASKPGVLGHQCGAYSQACETTAMIFTEDAEGLRIGPFHLEMHTLKRVLETMDLSPISQTMSKLDLSMDDLSAICVHVAALPFLPTFCEYAGLPQDKIVDVLSDHGDVVAAGLPLQLAKAVQSGRVQRGDLVGIVGLAAGVSLGMAVLRW